MRNLPLVLTLTALVGCSSTITKPEAWKPRPAASFTRDSAACKVEANKTNFALTKGPHIYEQCMISKGWEPSSQ